ncbi:hypothetical protein NC653_016552 [Populus alba x Populus x berolinensis]|uniref:Uncharacterized protein n=1 Tax=Populus alba x Populus x berolinensis TaxID=444605 RepID=A0AAD6VZI9_9ROSI|nr:hypothetical protein NC653_016552 [Populus alba x Populus x berolinensis]
MAITHEPARSPQKKRGMLPPRRGQIKKSIISKFFKVVANVVRALARKEGGGAQAKQPNGLMLI